MRKLNSFSPHHLVYKAKASGFFQCPLCGLVWFGSPESADTCPEGPHGPSVHVVVLCRSCNVIVSVAEIAAHLSSEFHIQCSTQQVAA